MNSLQSIVYTVHDLAAAKAIHTGTNPGGTTLGLLQA